MIRRRRETKRLLRIARMLREIDAAAAGGRPPRRRVERAAFSRV
jgi:hypothetical protein